MSTGPTQNTVNDFWKMVWQNNVVQIVMLTNLMEGTKVNNATVFLNLFAQYLRTGLLFQNCSNLYFQVFSFFSEKMCSILANLRHMYEL